MPNFVSANTESLKNTIQEMRLAIKTLRANYNDSISYGNGKQLEAQRQLQVIVPLYRNLVAYVQNSQYSDVGPKATAFAHYKDYYDKLVFIMTRVLQSPSVYGALDKWYPILLTLRIPFPARHHSVPQDEFLLVTGGTLREVSLALRMGLAEQARAKQNAQTLFLNSLTVNQKELLKAMAGDGRGQVTINLQLLK